MKIEEPKAEYWEQEDAKDHVARCARVCYQSKDRGHEANEKLYQALLRSGHTSMLRHESKYFIIPFTEVEKLSPVMVEVLGYLKQCPYVEISNNGEAFHIATNAQYMHEHATMQEYFNPYEVTPSQFKEQCPQLMRYTFCLTTQISTARELNRKSPNAISEMSTRYIEFGGKVNPAIVRPHWFDKDLTEDIVNHSGFLKERIYLEACENAFRDYWYLIKECDMKKEDARGVLPLDTLTKVVYTYSVKEWKHILNLRLFDKTGRAHENCKMVCKLVYDKLKKLGYDFEA